MDYITYCERLGLGFNDIEKQRLFINRMHTYFQSNRQKVFTEKDEFEFCYEIGEVCCLANHDILDLDWLNTEKQTGFQRVWIYLERKRGNFTEFLAALVTFANTYTGLKKDKEEIINNI